MTVMKLCATEYIKLNPFSYLRLENERRSITQPINVHLFFCFYIEGLNATKTSQHISVTCVQRNHLSVIFGVSLLCFLLKSTTHFNFNPKFW